MGLVCSDVYSLNAPVPPAVATLAQHLATDLPAADRRTRGEHTLICKRLGTRDQDYDRLEAWAREALTGAPTMEARIAGVDLFEEAAEGSSPVVYLAVQSPGLVDLHHRLAETFDPVPGIEGKEYVPHVTVARGGSLDAAHEVAERAVDPIQWTITELVFYDAELGETISRVSLPA